MRRKSHLLRDHFVDKFGREGQVERDSLHGACYKRRHEQDIYIYIEY
jgi:hypothetical protein